MSRPDVCYTIPISIDGDKVVTVDIIGPFPLNPYEWQQFNHVLEAMSIGLHKLELFQLKPVTNQEGETK